MSFQCNRQLAHNFHSVAGQPNQQVPGAYGNSNFSTNAPNAARNPAIQNPITFQQSATSLSQQQVPQHQVPQPGTNQQMNANTQPNYSALTSQNQVCSDQYFPSHPDGQQDVPGSPSANSRNVQPYQMNARWAAPMPRTESNVSCQNDLLAAINKLIALHEERDAHTRSILDQLKLVQSSHNIATRSVEAFYTLVTNMTKQSIYQAAKVVQSDAEAILNRATGQYPSDGNGHADHPMNISN